jgi:hypothetical protein
MLFFVKIYWIFDNFKYSKKQQKQQIMKQLVLQVAMALIAANSKTTTLDVKNECHRQNSNDPNFSLTQQEVSQFMSEMYREANGEVTREFQGQYYEYSMTPAAVAGMNTGAPVTKTTAVKTSTPKTSNSTGTRAPGAAAATSLGKVVDNDVDTNGDKYVAYDVNNTDEAYLFDTTNPLEARAGFKVVVADAVHENIRMMQFKHYNTKYAGATV